MDPYLGDFYSHPPVNFDTDTTDALDDMDAWGDVLRSTGWLEFDPATHEGSTVPMELDDDEEAEGDLGLNSMSLVDVPEAEDHIDSDSDSDGSSASDDIPDNGIPMALDVEDEQLLKQAHKLVQQGFSAEPWTASSKWSLKSTPRAFKNANKNTQFLPHQLSAAGWLMHSNLGGLLSYEMGLGKTFILIAVVLDHLKHHPEEQVLIVVPLQVLTQWKEEFETRINPQPKICVYHESTGISLKQTDITRYQVILTTFEVVRSQWAAWKQAADAFELKFAGGLPGRIPVRPFCPLNVAKFGLYIVDEIGKIGNAQTQTSRSIRAIHARKRIGATGTIIQNDYDELQCLMSFLLVEPWCNPVAFRKYFMLSKSGKSRARRLKGIRVHILAMTLRAFTLHLRQTDKFNGKPVVPFQQPQMEEFVHDLTETEQETQENTIFMWDYKVRKNKNEAARHAHEVTIPRRRILPEILDARRAIVHPACAKVKYGEQGEDDGNETVRRTGNEVTSLADSALKARQNLVAATRTDWQSTRLRLAIHGVVVRLAQEPAYKILVFDEFLSTLDVFANGLDAKGYNYYRYDNTIPTSVRESNRKAFQDPADPIKIMLCTIQCAGLGLNFTTARTVIILTPRWNPFFDKQAICRANRIGQTGVVVVYTYKCRDSIENHVYRLRAKKEKKYTGLFDPRHLNQDTLKRLRDLGFDDFKQTMGRLKGRLDGKAAEKLTEDNPSGLAREAHMHPPFAPAGPFPWSSGMFGLGSNVSGGI